MTLFYLFLIFICCLIIWKASDGFEVASEFLGKNLSDGVRGATINAIGSSMPELFTTLFFLFVLSESDNFAGGIGTTAGSAIFNGMIIPAVVIISVITYGIAKGVTVSKKVILRDGLTLIVAEFLLILLISGNSLYAWHGMVLMLMYAVYIVIMFGSMKRNQAENIEQESKNEAENDEKSSFVKGLVTLDLERVIIRGKELRRRNSWPLLLVSILVIGAACLLLVKACEGLGKVWDIPVYFIAVILASAATSIPDTIISIKDSMKGNYDDAVANALGSNIFDVCFALGFPLFLFTIINGPIQMSPETVAEVAELRILLLIFTIIAFFVYFIGRSMGWYQAIILLVIYVVFLIYILGRATEAVWAAQVATHLQAMVNGLDVLRFWQ